jgi:phosphate uptake regulator
MHTRKLQTVGGGTYTVSLPKEWVEGRGLDAGDPVDLHVRGDETLVLQTADRQSDRPNEAVVHEPPDTPEGLARTIRAAYNAGAPSVRIPRAELETTAHRRDVTRAVQLLSGVSTVEDDDGITARILLDTDEVSVPQAVRQLKFVTLTSLQDATDALTDGAPATQPTDHRSQPRRIRAMIERSFTTALDRLDELEALGVSRPALFELRETARHLDEITEQTDRIRTLAGEGDEPLSDGSSAKLVAVLDDARDLIEDSVAVILGDEGGGVAQDALATAETIRTDARSVESHLAASDHSGRDRLVADELRRLAHSGTAIAQLGLRKAIREGRLR